MIREELWKRRHRQPPEQGKSLGAVVRGYFAEHAWTCAGGGPSLRRRAVPTAITVRAPVELDAVGVGERSGCPDVVTYGHPAP